MAERGFHIADAYVSIYADKDPLKRDIEGLGNDPGLGTSAETSGKGLGKRTGKGISDGVDAKKIAKQAAKDFGDGGATDFGNAGRDSGNKLSQGFRLSIVRNSPVWAAAIGGALAAGAPAVTAAGSLLFIGVAAALAAQSLKVKQAWSTLGSTIVSDATKDSASLVPIFVNSASQIGAAFERLRPQFRDIFSALGPQIEVVTRGLINLVSNAMPGLVNIVRNAGPVMSGFADFLGRIGTGLSDFFTTLSQHSAAGGQVFSQLGQIIQTLLPIIGQLLGQGAELASRVLPLLSGSLRVVLSVLNAIAPILPIVAAGFLAFKTVTALSGPLNSLSGSLARTAQNLAFASYNGGAFAGTAGRMSSAVGAAGGAVSKVGAALPAIGLVVGLVGTAMEMASQQTDDWAQALMTGGKAADAATAQMQKIHDALTTGFTGFMANATGATTWANALGVGTNAAESTKQKVKELEAAMSPLQLAQERVTQAENRLQAVLADPNHTHAQVVAASDAVAAARGRVTSITEQVTAATTGASVAEQENATRLQAIVDKASAGTSAINLLKGALDALTGANMTADQAEIAITQSIANAINATQGLTGALTDANGHLDLSTQKGAAAGQALIGLAGNMHQEIAVLQQQGATTDQVSAKEETLRGQFLNTAMQMGFSAGEAQRLADRYFGIPGQIMTTVGMRDQASQSLINLNNLLNSVDGRQVVTTAINRVVTQLQTIQLPGFFGANGGVVHAFASGGFESMPGGMATIVPPRSFRVIGDRVQNDEAYIPINHDVSSQKTLRETSRRMGFDLTPVGQAPAGGGSITVENLTVHIAGTLDLTNPSSLRKLAVDIRDAIVKVEREAK